MKAVVIALALIATGTVLYSQFAPSNEVAIDELWNAWKLQQGKEYSATEDSMRRAIFEENFNMIQAHNADETQTFKMSLNKFADLTGEEFKEKVRCMDKASGSVGDEYCPSAVNCPTLPSSSATTYDWRTKGAVTPVKNQGQCGSCWAFSTTGSLEGLYYLDKNTLLSFSESQLVDCAQSCYGCEGCWPYIAMEYSAAHGMALEKLYPYHPVQRQCNIPKNITLIQTNTKYQCIQQKSVDQMKSGVVQQPVSIAVEADQSAFQFYSSGVVTSGCGDSLDHAILIVGFQNPDSDSGYWIVKNSWGADWGDQGYINIGSSPSQNQGYGVCGILRCGTIPTSN